MNIVDKENKLKRHGKIYNDTANGNAQTYKHNKTKTKFVWYSNQTWVEFIDNCLRFLNEETLRE